MGAGGDDGGDMGKYDVNGEFEWDSSADVDLFMGLHKFLRINNRVP